MSPLLFTLTFLTLISLLTSSELLHYSYQGQSRHMLKEAIQNEGIISSLVEEAKFEDLKHEKAATPRKRVAASQTPRQSFSKSATLKYNTARPPNNSRLNFYLLIQEEDPFYYDVAARLIRNLYQQCSFFTPKVEYELLDALIEHKNLMQGFLYPDELGTVQLNNEKLQNVLYHLLKGDEAPSLLNYITYDSEGSRTQKKINLLFASQALLEAIFDNTQLTTRLEALIGQLWVNIEEQKDEALNPEPLTRTKIRQQLQEQFDELISKTSFPEAIKKEFDFTLGKSGNILFIENPMTGNAIRKKI